jgi:glycosyltransferase involved in cell wall biosynthesis
MKPFTRIAVIGNSAPRRCGIATFTNDLETALSELEAVRTTIIAMSDHGGSYDYPKRVGFEIDDQNIDDYIKAAEFINNQGFDAVSLQHEFGIFGGENGCYILNLIERLKVPLTTTFHTILEAPTPAQCSLVHKILSASSHVVVMSQKGKSLLETLYFLSAHKIHVISHGISEKILDAPDLIKKRLGYANKTVILTFGLLSPNKGIEVMIDALPDILKAHSNLVYIVLGATHPNLVRRDGELYRESLMERAKDLGLNDQIAFIDQFVDKDTLLDYIAMSDIYVTPYLNEAQMTSGTLAYSFGMGKVVVSTPYWHAKELLADGLGILVPFNDTPAIAATISDLLCDDEARETMSKRAYEAGRAMIWPSVAKTYLDVFKRSKRFDKPMPVHLRSVSRREGVPQLHTEHFKTMCDSTGIIQHALFDVPDRSHGYCVDDNARALILACQLSQTPEALPVAYSSQFCAFIQHAWNKDNQRFRNFMSYDRHWLEAHGSEDSHARTLWALGVCARDGQTTLQRQWAKDLFSQALEPVIDFTSPRAWAFTLLGLEAINGDERVANLLANRLLELLDKLETPEHIWFETSISYDNARLSQAMLSAGELTRNPLHTQAGLKTLYWLLNKQRAPVGYFRAISTQGYHNTDGTIAVFDQQPLEAQATIAACKAAWLLTRDHKWLNSASAAFNWFLGDNDLNLPLVEELKGKCHDVLHPDRVNQNCGAESVLAYLLSLSDMKNMVYLMTYNQCQDLRGYTFTSQAPASLTAA